MLVLDTNVLIYASDPDSEFHEACRERIEGYRQNASPWYLSWPICYEFLRVVTHPHIPMKPWTVGGAWRFLEAILDCPSAGILLPTSRHAAILAKLLTEKPDLRGNILHDVHTAVLMLEHGIKQLCTHDNDFRRFSFITVIDPTT